MSVAVAAGICHLLQLGMQHGMLLRLLVAAAVVVVNAGVQIAQTQHGNSSSTRQKLCATCTAAIHVQQLLALQLCDLNKYAAPTNLFPNI